MRSVLGGAVPAAPLAFRGPELEPFSTYDGPDGLLPALAAGGASPRAGTPRYTRSRNIGSWLGCTDPLDVILGRKREPRAGRFRAHNAADFPAVKTGRWPSHHGPSPIPHPSLKSKSQGSVCAAETVLQHREFTHQRSEGDDWAPVSNTRTPSARQAAAAHSSTTAPPPPPSAFSCRSCWETACWESAP